MTDGKPPEHWEVPVFGAELLDLRTMTFSAETGRVLMSIGEPVIVPDESVTGICAAARSAHSLARRQRERTR